MRRIENIIDKLPAAKRQAHERIIGERKVASLEKLLSLYEDDIHVIVRGKVSSEVEFGNGLYLAEQQNGIIVDWCFFKDQPPSDILIVKPSVERITARYGKPFCYTGDRGFIAKPIAHISQKTVSTMVYVLRTYRICKGALTMRCLKYFRKGALRQKDVSVKEPLPAFVWVCTCNVQKPFTTKM